MSAERSSHDIIGLTHQDLAETIGTYRETATQVLNDMKAQGLIEIGRKRITIKDADTAGGSRQQLDDAERCAMAQLRRTV